MPKPLDQPYGVAMKISKRGEYALRALIDLGIAKELGRDLLRIGEMAEKENMPVKFLEAILMQLKEAGFVDSKRGKAGGYFIKMPMELIKFGTVIRQIDGPLAPIACVSQTAYQRCTCPDEEHCGLRMLMLDVRNAIADILDRYSLDEVVKVTLRKMRRDKFSPPLFAELEPFLESKKAPEQPLRKKMRVGREPVKSRKAPSKIEKRLQ